MSEQLIREILAWMGEHWFITIVALICISQWRPLTIFDGRQDHTHKTKTKIVKSEAA